MNPEQFTSRVREVGAGAVPVVRRVQTIAAQAGAASTDRLHAAREAAQPAIQRFGRTTARSTRNVAGLFKPAARSTGAVAVRAVQRSEVAWQRADRGRLARVGAGLLGVALVAGVATAVLDDESAGAGGTATATAAVDPAATVSPQAFVIERISHGRNGNIFALVGGQPLFPLPSGALVDFEYAPVEMQGVPVHSVVADNGMWVGESAEQRVFVTVSTVGSNTGSRLPASFQPGDLLNISGRMVPVPGLEALGVSADEGAEQLFMQNYMVEAVSLRPPTAAPEYRNS